MDKNTKFSLLVIGLFAGLAYCGVFIPFFTIEL